VVLPAAAVGAQAHDQDQRRPGPALLVAESKPLAMTVGMSADLLGEGWLFPAVGAGTLPVPVALAKGDAPPSESLPSPAVGRGLVPRRLICFRARKDPTPPA